MEPAMNLEDHLSPHLTFGEAVTTDHVEFAEKQDNPPPDILGNMRRFANGLFEQSRSVVGCAWHVNSMYRCPELNAVLHGHSKTSQHMLGLAADLRPLGTSLLAAFDKLRLAVLGGTLPADQLIWEYGRWVHLGDVLPALAAVRGPRRQILMIFEPDKYLPFDPADARLPRAG